MRLRAFFLATLLALSGCAAAMMDSPASNWRPRDAPRCSESRGGVALDGLLASLYGVGSIAAFGESEGEFGLALGLLSGLHLASAVVGNRSAMRCKKANDEHTAWVAARQKSRKELGLVRARAGSRSGPCRGDGTCDDGLECHPEAKICVLDHLATGEPTAEGAPAAERAADAEEATAAPAESEKPAVEAPADGDAAPYADFWREVKR